MKLLSILSLATIAAAAALPEVTNTTETAGTRDWTGGHCGVQLTYTQVCTLASPKNYVHIARFTDPVGQTINDAGWGGGWGQLLGKNGKDRWTLNGVMDSPFVTREYEDHGLHLQFEYQGCFLDSNTPAPNGCGRCNVANWSADWDTQFCWDQKNDKARRTQDMNCWFECHSPA